MFGGDDADFGTLLTDKAESAVSLPLVLPGLVDVDRNARGDCLLDLGIDDAGMKSPTTMASGFCAIAACIVRADEASMSASSMGM